MKCTSTNATPTIPGYFFARWLEEGKNRFTGADETFTDDRRTERISRALDEKTPKLHAAAQAYGLKSVLVLESKHIALSNILDIGQAFKRALGDVRRRLISCSLWRRTVAQSGPSPGCGDADADELCLKNDNPPGAC
jgi:hypothetical protein